MAAEEGEGSKVVIFFLDVDGVLNTATSSCQLETHLLKNLIKLLTGTPNSRLVVSSTWRYSSAMKSLLDEIESRGYNRSFILGATPDLSQGSLAPYPPHCSHLTRTDEILLWLLVNTKEGEGREWVHGRDYNLGRIPQEQWQGNRVSVSSFLAIDDMRLDGRSCFAKRAEMVQRQILTHVKDGLTEELTQEAFKRLEFPFCFTEWCSKVYGPCDNEECLHLEKEEDKKDETQDKREQNSPKTKNRRCHLM